MGNLQTSLAASWSCCINNSRLIGMANPMRALGTSEAPCGFSRPNRNEEFLRLQINRWWISGMIHLHCWEYNLLANHLLMSGIPSIWTTHPVDPNPRWTATDKPPQLPKRQKMIFGSTDVTFLHRSWALPFPAYFHQWNSWPRKICCHSAESR